MSHLRKILSQYSFKLVQQQSDVIRLLYLANCFHPHVFLKDLNATGHSFAQLERASQIVRQITEHGYTDLENFHPNLILDNLFFNSFSSWPEKIHNWLLLVTQREFFARKQHEVYGPSIRWEKKYQQEIATLTNRLGLHQKFKCERESYAGVALFNATEDGLIKRLIQLNDTIKKESLNSLEYLYLYCGAWKMGSDADFLKRIGCDEQFSSNLVNKIYLMNAIVPLKNAKEQCSIKPILGIELPKGKKLHEVVNNTLLELAKARPNLEDEIIWISSRNSNAEHTAYAQLVQSAQRTDPGILKEVNSNLTSTHGITALGRLIYHGYLPVALALGAEDSKHELELKKDKWSIENQLKLGRASEMTYRRPKL